MVNLNDDLERTVAGIAGGSTTMDTVAAQAAALARAGTAAHRGPTGNYSSMIDVVKAGGGKDRLIVNSDPLAAPKEFGHVLIRNGQQIGYVRGLHAMRNAIDRMPAVS